MRGLEGDTQPNAEFLKDKRVALVTSRFNLSITQDMEAGALEGLMEAGLHSDQIFSVRVPGAVEIPIAAQALLEQGYSGVVALGCVIRGETSHYDYVCSSVEKGITELNLKYGRPVAFGVLTTENRAQAEARCGGDKGHKGREAAEVVIEMMSLLSKIKHLAKGES